MSGRPMSRMTASIPVGRLGDLEAGLAVGGHLDDVAVLLEQPSQRPAESLVVLDDQEMHRALLLLRDDRDVGRGRRDGAPDGAGDASGRALAAARRSLELDAGPCCRS